MPLGKYDLMISFREADTGVGKGGGEAAALKAELVRLGFSVFLSADSIPPGTDWQEAIADGVSECRAVVALCSETYGESDGVSKEMKLADHNKKPIIPVLHSGPWPPKNCRLMLAGSNYTTWEGAVETASALLVALEKHGITAPSEQPPPLPTVVPTLVQQDAGGADDSARGRRTSVDPGTLVVLQEARISAEAIDKMVEEWGFWSLSDLKGVVPDDVDELGLKRMEANRLKEVVSKQNAAPARPASARRKAHLEAATAPPPPPPDLDLAALRAEKDPAKLVAAMRARFGDAGVQEAGCEALKSLTANNADNRVAAGRAGAIQAVVAAMRAHGAHAGVQERGCVALSNITCDNADNQVAAGRFGAIETVVAAMRAHGAHAGVQEHGCLALGNITANNADNTVAAGRFGAIEAVVAAMRAHGAHAGVQEQGCSALAWFTEYNADKRVAAGRAGAIEAVVAAMRAHGAHAGVQEQGCLALACFTAGNADNKVAAGRAGAIEAVVAAMRAHGAHAGVQEQGCPALACFTSGNADNTVAAGRFGAIEAVVAAMRAHGAHAGLQQRGCWALGNITANNADKLNTVAAGRAGAVEAVVAAMRAHGAHAGVQEEGCDALRIIAGSDAALKARSREAGAEAVLRAAIKAHPGGKVAECAQKSLDKIV